MKSKDPSRIPSPQALLAEVQRRPPAPRYPLADYVEVIAGLRSKGQSYAEAARFLSERLGIRVTRGQVYRAHRIWRREGPAPAIAAPAGTVESLIRLLDERFSGGPLPLESQLSLALAAVNGRDGGGPVPEEADLPVEKR